MNSYCHVFFCFCILTIQLIVKAQQKQQQNALLHFMVGKAATNITTNNNNNNNNITNKNNVHVRPKRQFVNPPGLFHCSNNFNGAYSCFNYRILPGPMNWFGAATACQQMGGTLFSPSSLEDVYYIMGAIQPYRTGTISTNRSFWLGMACQCQFGNPFGCYQCMWADGRPVSAFAFPPTNPLDQRIGPLWSNMYNRPDHFARSLNGQMCLFVTDHWALYECNFADLQGGAVCQIPYGTPNGVGIVG